MKRCPACNTTYGDEQNFCLNDGSTLVADASGSFGASAPTESMPYGSGAKTEVLYGTPTAPPTPPTSYMPAPQVKRSPLPWIIVGVVVIAGIVVAIILLTRGGSGSGATSNVGTSTPIGSSSPRGPAGQQYTSPDGKFSIALPPGFGPFKAQKNTQPTLAGPIELNILQSETQNGACVVGYSDFPVSSFEGRSEQKMLEDGRDGALRNINATLEKQENFTLQGRTGLAVYGSTTAQGRSVFVRFNFVLDKPRAYQVGYLAYERADLDKPETQAYFDSFRMN